MDDAVSTDHIIEAAIERDIEREILSTSSLGILSQTFTLQTLD